MKSYNIQNYIRYKQDLEVSIKTIPNKAFNEYSREELIITFLPALYFFAVRFISAALFLAAASDKPAKYFAGTPKR